MIRCEIGQCVCLWYCYQVRKILNTDINNKEVIRYK
jgi:hypothetical protein